MPRHDVTKLETKVKQLRIDIRKLAAGEDLAEVIRLIRRPGWTTPAEFRLVLAAADAMQAQVKLLSALQKTVLSASREIATGAAKTARSR